MSTVGAPRRRDPRRLALFMAAMLLGSVLVAVIGAWLLWEWPGMLLVGGVLTADILTRLDVL